MAAHHGSVGEFDAGKETWTSYCERLQLYFLANDVAATAEKQRAIFLTVCGATTYQLIGQLEKQGAGNGTGTGTGTGTGGGSGTGAIPNN